MFKYLAILLISIMPTVSFSAELTDQEIAWLTDAAGISFRMDVLTPEEVKDMLSTPEGLEDLKAYTNIIAWKAKSVPSFDMDIYNTKIYFGKLGSEVTELIKIYAGYYAVISRAIPDVSGVTLSHTDGLRMDLINAVDNYNAQWEIYHSIINKL